MKTSLRRLGLIVSAAVAFAFVVSAALAIQPGTTGTNKQWQASGLRIGVPVMVNNTATSAAWHEGPGLAGTATLNAAASGIITTESLTTTAATEYTLTLVNNLIAATDIVLFSVGAGTNTAGAPEHGQATPGAGQVILSVRNGHASAAFNGTLKIQFLVIKQSALGAD